MNNNLQPDPCVCLGRPRHFSGRRRGEEVAPFFHTRKQPGMATDRGWRQLEDARPHLRVSGQFGARTRDFSDRSHSVLQQEGLLRNPSQGTTISSQQLVLKALASRCPMQGLALTCNCLQFALVPAGPREAQAPNAPGLWEGLLVLWIIYSLFTSCLGNQLKSRLSSL